MGSDSFHKLIHVHVHKFWKKNLHVHACTPLHKSIPVCVTCSANVHMYYTWYCTFSCKNQSQTSIHVVCAGDVLHAFLLDLHFFTWSAHSMQMVFQLLPTQHFHEIFGTHLEAICISVYTYKFISFCHKSTIFIGYCWSYYLVATVKQQSDVCFQKNIYIYTIFYEKCEIKITLCVRQLVLIFYISNSQLTICSMP